jgi:hypothetical protein
MMQKRWLRRCWKRRSGGTGGSSSPACEIGREVWTNWSWRISSKGYTQYRRCPDHLKRGSGGEQRGDTFGHHRDGNSSVRSGERPAICASVKGKIVQKSSTSVVAMGWASLVLLLTFDIHSVIQRPDPRRPIVPASPRHTCRECNANNCSWGVPEMFSGEPTLTFLVCVIEVLTVHRPNIQTNSSLCMSQQKTPSHME